MSPDRASAFAAASLASLTCACRDAPVLMAGLVVAPTILLAPSAAGRVR